MSRLFGWETISKLFRSQAQKLRSDQQSLLKEVSQEIRVSARRVIDMQWINGPPLADSTKSRKQAAGYDPRMLIEKGSYKDSFVAHPVSDDAYLIAPDTLENRKKMIWHEYGTDVAPPRPHLKNILFRAVNNRKMKKLIEQYGFELVSATKADVGM